MPDSDIGHEYAVSFGTLQRIITESYGANISVLKKAKRIKRWAPRDFREERSTVWSFRNRGDWATHDGRYRGNWSPYVPRNVILKYTSPGDVVVDYFAGGGTTAVEAKLLGRRCITVDINPGAVGMTRENLQFRLPGGLFGCSVAQHYEPEVRVGDARDLSQISSNSVDLICAHPPYAGIIKYSTGIPGDLSDLSVDDFLNEMAKVAHESLRILKPGAKCAILIGDARKSKHVVPIGFGTIRVFLDAGFRLRELVIKRQHNCKTTGFWHERSIKYNFLLLAHEYLPIFEKPAVNRVSEQVSLWEGLLREHAMVRKAKKSRLSDAETTTVWLLPERDFDTRLMRNLLTRFAKPGTEVIELSVGKGEERKAPHEMANASLIYVRSADQLKQDETVHAYRSTVRGIATNAAKRLAMDGVLVVEARDTRAGTSLTPTSLLLWEDFQDQVNLRIKEIIIVVPTSHCGPVLDASEFLQITHKYLLVFVKEGMKP